MLDKKPLGILSSIRAAFLNVPLLHAAISISLLLVSVAIADTPPYQVPGPVVQAGDSSFASILIGLGFMLLTALLSIIGTLIKRQLDQILTAQADILCQQRSCRESLAERFAAKTEVREEIKEMKSAIKRLHERVDDLCG